MVQNTDWEVKRNIYTSMSIDFVAASEAWKKQVGYISWKHIWHMWLEFTKRWSCSLQIPGLLGLGRITLGPLVSCPVMGVAEVWRATPRYTLQMSNGVMSTLALASIKTLWAEYPAMPLYYLSDVAWYFVTSGVSYQRDGDCGEMKGISVRVFVDCV